jgi:phosphoserine phosphatase
VIASGGYLPYIKVFSQKHKIKHSFATQIDIKDKKITGQFNGKDCLYNQKVILIEEFLNANPIKYASSVAYSDSITDLPLLQWADEGVVVSKHKSQDWAAKNNLKEIIHN